MILESVRGGGIENAAKDKVLIPLLERSEGEAKPTMHWFRMCSLRLLPQELRYWLVKVFNQKF